MRHSTLAWLSGAVVVAVMLCVPATAAGQISIGSRMTFAKGAESPVLDGTNESSARFAGGFVRLRAGRIGLEGAIDFRSNKDAAETATVKSYPVQGSVLYYIGNYGVAPYLVGGVGYYTQRLAATADGGDINAVAHSFGYHAGIGTELSLGRRLSVFVDYRYTFADLPTFEALTGAAIGAALVPNLLATGNSLGINTKGSMWTTGVAVHF